MINYTPLIGKYNLNLKSISFIFDTNGEIIHINIRLFYKWEILFLKLKISQHNTVTLFLFRKYCQT